jgi:hypothetical protein
VSPMIAYAKDYITTCKLTIHTTRKIEFRNGYLEPVFKKQVLKDESGVISFRCVISNFK